MERTGLRFSGESGRVQQNLKTQRSQVPGRLHLFFFDTVRRIPRGHLPLHLPLLMPGVGLTEHEPAPTPLYHVAVPAALPEDTLGLEALCKLQVRHGAAPEK